MHLLICNLDKILVKTVGLEKRGVEISAHAISRTLVPIIYAIQGNNTIDGKI
jgi:hypothetical protein